MARDVSPRDALPAIDTGSVSDASPPVINNLMTQERWVTQQGGFWDTQKWVTGDFDGDGKTDLANVFGDSGLASMDTHRSTGGTFTFERWATQQGGFADDENWLAGDFDGDGKTDLANAFGEFGQVSIDIHRSAGTTFTFERWLTSRYFFWDTQKWLSGDFDGDGKADLANVFDDLGQVSVDVYLSTGETFTTRRWVTEQGEFEDAQKWLAGDFDGDGKTDLACVYNDMGLASIDVRLSDGSTFIPQRWATQQLGVWDTQKWVAGDFDGDGRADLANVFGDAGLVSIDLHLSTGASFVPARWVTREGGFWDAQKWLPGDFDGDGRTDLANVFGDPTSTSIDVRRRRHP